MNKIWIVSQSMMTPVRMTEDTASVGNSMFRYQLINMNSNFIWIHSETKNMGTKR